MVVSDSARQDVITALLFPGQGSQEPGMLHRLPNDPAVQSVRDEMAEALHQDVWECDSEIALKSTVSTQLALLASGVASARIIMNQGLKPLVVAGISVGAYAAAVTAQAISLGDASRLVRTRAELMEKMYPSGYGLAAIVGLTETQVTKLVDDAYTDANPVFVANINAPRQIVIAGAEKGMEKVVAAALKLGAYKARLLNVSVPSHCKLLAPVAQSLRTQIQAVTVSDPKIIYIANVNARAIRSAEGILVDLVDNIAHGVRWHDATSVAQELGCTFFLQVPPGHVLADLARENLSGVRAYSMAAIGAIGAVRLADE